MDYPSLVTKSASKFTAKIRRISELYRRFPVMLRKTDHTNTIVSRLSMELELQSLFGHHLHSCTHCLKPRSPPSPIGSYTRALLVSQDRRHLFVTFHMSDYKLKIAAVKYKHSL
jgi:hypothetical protein